MAVAEGLPVSGERSLPRRARRAGVVGQVDAADVHGEPVRVIQLDPVVEVVLRVLDGFAVGGHEFVDDDLSGGVRPALGGAQRQQQHQEQ